MMILHIKKLTSDFSVAASAYITKTGHLFGRINTKIFQTMLIGTFQQVRIYHI